MTTTAFTSPPQDATICTLDDVKAYLRLPTSDTAYDTEITNLLYVATDLIEVYCNRPIVPKVMPTESHDGWAGDTIMLLYRPVVSVQSVTEYWSTGGPHVLSEVSPSSPGDGYQLEARTGRLIRSFDGVWPKPWFPGSRNVVVDYTAGYATMPPTLWQAAREFVAHIFAQGEQFNPVGIPKFSGNESVDQLDQKPGLWAGVPFRIETKLKPFRRHSIA